jgi:hypothetical protein
VLRWPHGGHGDCASARTGYGVRQWARPAGTRVGGRFTALQRHQRCCRFEAFTVVPWKVLRASDGSAKAENASLAQECGHPRTGGAEACRATMPHPRGVRWAPFWAFCYEITDLRIYPPPSPSHAPTRSRAPPNQVTAGNYNVPNSIGPRPCALRALRSAAASGRRVGGRADRDVR